MKKDAPNSDPRLTDLIDADAVQALLDGFADLTGLAASVWDVDGQRIGRPAGESAFCGLVMASPAGRSACDASHARAAELARIAGSTCGHQCHAGLAQLASAITVEGRTLGTLIVGDRPLALPNAEQLEDLATLHGLDSAALSASCGEMQPWSESAMTAARRFVGQLAETISRLCHQSLQLRQRVDELAAIHDVASMLAGHSEPRKILDLSLNRLVEVMGLRAASARLLDDETGELRIAAVANLSPAYLNKGPLLVASSPIDEEALAGRTVYIADMPTDPRTVYKDDARREGLASGLVAPLASGGRTIGVMRAYTGKHQEFTPFDVALLQALAAQVASAIVTARLYEEAREADRLDRQVRLAADVQRRMIPAHPPANGHYEFGCVYEPSAELCGDFYDFLEFPSGEIGIVIADVVGKGVPASLIMASARSALRSHAKRVADVATVMAEVNQRLFDDTLDSEFVTAFYGVLGADGKTLTYCNAGHEPPLLARDGRIVRLGGGGMLLGIDTDAQYASHVEHLRPGDVLVFLTDGLVEAIDYQDEVYGRRRLHESIRRHLDCPTGVMAKQLLWDVRRFAGLATRSDDITLVVVRVLDQPQ